MYTPLSDEEYIKNGMVYRKINGVETMIRKATEQAPVKAFKKDDETDVDEKAVIPENEVVDSSVQTPLKIDTNTLAKEKSGNIDRIEEQKNNANKAIDDSITAVSKENEKINTNSVKASSKNIPKAPELDTGGTYIGADGSPKKLQYQTYDEWANSNNKTLPSDEDLNRSSDQYKVNEEAIEEKNRQTKRQKLGDQLVIAGAMFQELGNPQLYKGATQAAADSVLGRADTRDEKVKDKIEKALAIKEAEYEGNINLMERLQTRYSMDMEYVDNQIKLLDFNNGNKTDDYNNQMTQFTAQLDVVKADHKQEMDLYGINIDKMTYIAEAYGDKFANEKGFDEAFDGLLGFMKDVQTIDKNSFDMTLNVSKELTAMFKDPNHPMYGSTYEEKKAHASNMARNDFAASQFVDFLPETEAEYVDKELLNIQDHANQWIKIGQEVFGMDLTDSAWLAYENIIGGDLAPTSSNVTTIDDGNILTKDEKIDLTSQFNKYGRVFTGLNTAMGMLNENGDIASFKNTLATSQIGVGLIDIANQFGIETTGLDNFVGEANEYNKLIQPLAVELIQYFTGEGSSRISEPERKLAFEAMDLLKLGTGELFADPSLTAKFYGNLMQIADARQMDAKTQLISGKRDLTTAKDKIGTENINTYEETTSNNKEVNDEKITMNNAKVFNSSGFKQALEQGDKTAYSELIKISNNNPEYSQNEKNNNRLALEQKMRQDARKFNLSDEELEAWINSTLYGG